MRRPWIAGNYDGRWESWNKRMREEGREVKREGRKEEEKFRTLRRFLEMFELMSFASMRRGGRMTNFLGCCGRSRNQVAGLNALKRELCSPSAGSGQAAVKKTPRGLASGLGEESWRLSSEIIVEAARRYRQVGIATNPPRDWIAALERTGRRGRIFWGNTLRRRDRAA
jgi:hypothetical protein